MSDKQWWEPLIEDDGKLDWLCDHEGDYSEKINELWAQFTALREQLKQVEAGYATRNDEVTGLLGMNAELREQLAAGAEELAACSAAFDKQQEQLDRNADQIVELISETKLVVEKNKVLCELLAECQKDADRYVRVRQHLRNGHNTLDMRGTDSDADFDALLDKHLTKGNKVYNYRDIASEVAQEAAAHTDHPLRHYDRTCPACNPKKEWVGLTDDEFKTIMLDTYNIDLNVPGHSSDDHLLWANIESKLKEKNGG